MSVILRTSLPLWIMIFTALTMVVEYFFNIPMVPQVAGELRTWAVLFTNLTMAGSVVGLTIICIKDIMKRAKGLWYYRVWILILMYGWLITGLILGSNHTYYTFMFSNVVAVLYQSIMGVVVFSMFTALYRSMRLRSYDTVLLTLATLVTILGSVPIGEAIWPGFPLIKTWLVEVPVVGANRGLTIVAAIGSVAISFRIMMGKDRLWMGIVEAIEKIKKEGT